MEKQRNLDAAVARSFHLETLSRQNNSNTGRDVGCLDPVNGDHLFVAAGAAISVVRTGAFVLGLAPDLHDESLRRKSRSRRADGIGDGERVGAIDLNRPRAVR